MPITEAEELRYVPDGGIPFKHSLRIWGNAQVSGIQSTALITMAIMNRLIVDGRLGNSSERTEEIRNDDMSEDNQLITVTSTALPVFSITSAAKNQRDGALAQSSLIGRVQNTQENAVAVSAQKELKRISNLFEKERKRLSEPLLEAKRQLDRTVAAELLEIEKEAGRLQQLTSGFQLEEQRRVREEQERQRLELERIEREEREALRKIQEEKERVEREAREAQERADRLVAEAKTKAERAAADKIRQEAEAKQRKAEETAALADQQSASVQERAAEQKLIEGKPISTTRETGQVVKTDWDINVVNPYELARCHPQCVKIEALKSEIKQLLNQGIAVRGVKAEKITVASVRAPLAQKAIDV